MKKTRNNWFTDIVSVLYLRWKLIWSDKPLLAVLVLAILIVAVLVRSLASGAEKQSSLPIGMIDFDKSISSEKLVASLKEEETLRVVELDEKTLHELLLDEMLLAIFVIEEGYEVNIKSGALTDCVTLYYKKDNKAATILADIVAGEMIKDISFYKGYRYYKDIEENGIQLSEQQYRAFLEELIKNSADFDFAFNMVYKNRNSAELRTSSVSNTLLYNQFVFGILGILTSLLIMFQISQVVREKENGAAVRLQTTKLTPWKRDIGDLLSVLLLEAATAGIFTGLIYHQLRIEDYGVWISAYLLQLSYALVIALLLLIFAKLLHSMLFYQVFCSLIILFTGGLGFYHLLSGFYQGYFDQLLKIIPNSWFIQGFTDIIIYGSRNGYLKEGHLTLLAMASILLFLVIGFDLIKELGINRLRNKRNRTV